MPIVTSNDQNSKDFEISLLPQKPSMWGNFGFSGTKRAATTPFVDHSQSNLIVVDLKPASTNKTILGQDPKALAKKLYDEHLKENRKLDSVVFIVNKVFNAPFGEELSTFLSKFQDELSKLAGRPVKVHAPMDPNYTKANLIKNKEGQYQLEAKHCTGRLETLVTGDVVGYLMKSSSCTYICTPPRKGLGPQQT